MGFRFRKTLKAGPLRVTLSKSGVGASVGVKGFRTGIGADGRHRTTITGPAGLSYQTSSSIGGHRGYGSASMMTSPNARPGVSSSPLAVGCLVATIFAGMFGLIAVAVVALADASAVTIAGVFFGTIALVVAGIMTIRAIVRSRVRAVEQVQARAAWEWQQHQAWEAQQAAQRAAWEAQQAAERVAHEAEQARQRFEALAAQFGHEAATKIVGRELWVGETAAMVKASFGEPVDVSESVLKTKVKHTFKFDRLPGNNRFGLKVHLDDGVVVGWDRAND